MAAPFAVERAPTAALCCPLKHRTVHVALLKDYPVSFWSLSGESTLVSLPHRLSMIFPRVVRLRNTERLYVMSLVDVTRP